MERSSGESGAASRPELRASWRCCGESVRYWRKACATALSLAGWQAGKLLHAAANLLTLLRRESFHGLGAVKETLPLLRGHAVELGEPVAHALLDRRRQLVEARLMLECALLVRRGELAVAVHPFGQVLLPRAMADIAALPTAFRRVVSIAPAVRRRRCATTPELGRGCERSGGKCDHQQRRSQQ